jgi:hypothetical protein
MRTALSAVHGVDEDNTGTKKIQVMRAALSAVHGVDKDNTGTKTKKGLTR